MGEVYRARDSRLDREVAVKVLPTAVASDPERLRRFEREGKAASSLNHPNILTVHDVGAEAGVAFLVTELLSGESLRQAVRRGPLPARRVTEIGVQLARGLAAAHERGIVHRDLKPENLFLTDDGVAKILDFGLARPVGTATADGAGEAVTLSRPEPVTAEGALLGTAGYMSPEQVRGEPADARSDLFAFGCVLHELLSGARAFTRASVADTCAAILRDPPPDLAAAVPGLPPALLAVVRRCLEKRPQDRFQNARDLAFALEQATSAPGGASSEAPAARAPDRRRGRWRAVVVVAGVVAVVGASWVVRRGGHSSPPERAEPTPSDLAVAVLPFANLSGNPENEYLGDGLAEEVINVLARSNVRVVARTSAFSFKGQNLDVREIARRLGVGAVVEGSVRQAGGRLRVTAQLIRADSGFHLWSETFDRSAADVFAVEDEIARAVLGNLRPPGAAAPPAVAPRAARDPAAHELFLRGRLELRTWAADSLERAEALLEKAVAADPGFGDAWAALAETVIVRHERHQVRDREAAYAKASDAARRALASEPPSAEGHAALSHILWHERRWSVAEDEARRALALSPGSAIAHEWLAAAAIAQGRLEEAEAGFRQALALDPLSVPYHSNHGLVLNALGRYAEAASAIERGWQLRPQRSIAGATASWTAANALVRLGRLDEANRWVERTAGIPGLETYATALRARVLVGRGDHQGARAALPHAVSEVPRGDRGVTSVASACFLLGDVERGLDWLEHAGSSFRGDRLAFDRFQPEMQKVMAHPRMQAFLREANLAGLPATGPGTPPAR